jgi:hypothetical protein
MSEDIIMLDAKSLLEMDIKRLADFMGNPDLNAYSNKAEDHDYSTFFFHSLTMKSVLDATVSRKSPIKILELGSGNGANGRTFCRLIDPDGDRPLHLVHLDFFDQNLMEAAKRNKEFSQARSNFSFQCIQADVKSPNTREKLISFLKETIDVAFSIKFFHNTPVKITREMAKFLSSIMTIGGVFILQCYGSQKRIDEIINGLNRARGHGYSNSVSTDRILAKWFLKNAGFRLIYTTTNKATDHGAFNHFQHARYDYYFEKVR